MPVLLCIDDQETSLQVRKMFLESQGYGVLAASSGQQGLQMLANNAVDVVILDYRMPGMDGEEVAREVRRLQPDLPIIMLSGYVSDFPESLRSLADAFVVKGSPPKQLLNAIAQFAGRSGRTPQTHRAEDILEVGRRQLATSRQHVRRARERVQENANTLQQSRSRRSQPRKSDIR